MMSKTMERTAVTAATTALMVLAAGTASAQSIDDIRKVNINFTDTAPIIDGVVTPGEWDAAPVNGNWSLLRKNVDNDGVITETPDANNFAWRGLWTPGGLSLLVTSEQASYSSDRSAGFFSADDINFYLAPNHNGRDNVTDNGDGTFSADNTGYQLAYQTLSGTTSYDFVDGVDFGDNGEGGTLSTFLEGHVGGAFGNAGGFAGHQNAKIAQINNPGSGVFEMFLPWTDLTAGTGGTNGDGNGLFHPYAPSNGDTWFFEVGFISATEGEAGNFLPVWNNNGQNSFAPHTPFGHGEITFVGAPDVIDGSALIGNYAFEDDGGGTAGLGSTDQNPATAAGDLSGFGSNATPGSYAIAGEDATATTEGDAFANDQFVEFAVTPENGATMSLTSLSFTTIFESLNGVFQWALRADEGDDAFGTLLGSGEFEGLGNTETIRVDLESHEFLQNLTDETTFRLALFDALGDEDDNDVFIDNLLVIGVTEGGELPGGNPGLSGADTNLIVDAEDLAALRNNFGLDSATNPDGDIIGEDGQFIGGTIGAAQLAALRNNFGTDYNIGVIPEPASIALLGLSALSLVRRRR